MSYATDMWKTSVDDLRSTLQHYKGGSGLETIREAAETCPVEDKTKKKMLMAAVRRLEKTQQKEIQ